MKLKELEERRAGTLSIITQIIEDEFVEHMLNNTIIEVEDIAGTEYIRYQVPAFSTHGLEKIREVKI